jgi:flagellar motor switch protein FliM
LAQKTSGPIEQLAVAPSPEEATRRLRPFDFRNPSKMARDHVRRMELTHETFQRALGAKLSSVLRTMVRLELLAIDQVTYDEYVRAMPNPTVITAISMNPLPDQALIEMSTSTALTLVDRLLGGIGKPGLNRRPTELEAALIADLMRTAESAMQETFEPLLAIEPQVTSVEFNPNFVHGANPSEMVMVMSFSLSVVQGLRSEGLVTICYPFSMLEPLWEMMPSSEEQRPALGAGDTTPPQILGALSEIAVPIAVRLRESGIGAGELASLQVGDVVRLDHKVNEAVVASVAGRKLLEGRIGRKGKNVALEISNWRSE